MGAILKPICNCEEVFRPLFLGGGMMNHNDYVYVPYYCDDESDRFYNPEKVVFDCIIGMDLQYILEDKKYHCPSCKKDDLEFEKVGLWD